ncbi:MAG TPA: hypothetical protein VF777_11130 [Phycisphaerales bacterium]
MAFPSDNPDVRCFRCGYSLAGLNGDALCPECAFSVAASRDPIGMLQRTLRSVGLKRARLRNVLYVDIPVLVCAGAVLLSVLAGPSLVLAVLSGSVFLLASFVSSIAAVLLASDTGSGSLRPVRIERAATTLQAVAALRLVLLGVAVVSSYLLVGKVGVAAGVLWLALATVELVLRVWWISAVVDHDTVANQQRSAGLFSVAWVFGGVSCTIAIVWMTIALLGVGRSLGDLLALGWLLSYAALLMITMELTDVGRTFLAGVPEGVKHPVQN